MPMQFSGKWYAYNDEKLVYSSSMLTDTCRDGVFGVLTYTLYREFLTDLGAKYKAAHKTTIPNNLPMPTFLALLHKKPLHIVGHTYVERDVPAERVQRIVDELSLVYPQLTISAASVHNQFSNTMHTGIVVSGDYSAAHAWYWAGLGLRSAVLTRDFTNMAEALAASDEDDSRMWSSSADKSRHIAEWALIGKGIMIDPALSFAYGSGPVYTRQMARTSDLRESTVLLDEFNIEWKAAE